MAQGRVADVRLIGLTGTAGVGKDAVAAILVRAHGFARMSFAAPLKQGLMAMFGIQAATLEDRAAKEAPIDWIGHSPRYLLQTLGTEWARQLVHPDIWIRRAERDLVHYRRISQDVAVTDVRFPNEAEWVRRMGGEVWHIHRPLPSNVVRMHSSEAGVAALRGADSLIHNDAGLEQLQDEVARAMAGELVIAKGAA